MAQAKGRRQVRQVRPVKNNPAAQRVKRSGGSKKSALDQKLHRRIREEAAKVNMSEADYLRLAVHVSELVRTKFLPAGMVDGGIIKMILSNPAMLDMLKGMVGNMVSKMGSGDKDSDSGSSSGGSTHNAPAAGAMPPWGHPHMYPMHPGAHPGAHPGPWGHPSGMMPGMPHGPGMMPHGFGPPHPQAAQGTQESNSSSSKGGFSMENLTNMVMRMFGNSSSS
jgi:hypothetical protein